MQSGSGQRVMALKGEKMDVVALVQAWIVANETVAAEHHAQLVEQVVDDHLRDFCRKINKVETEYRSGCERL